MTSFPGLSSIFKTIGRHYTYILEKEAVIITQYTPDKSDAYHPNNTVKASGYYYSANTPNAPITYHIPYIRTLVRGYSLTSHSADVYPNSWVLEASNDGVNFTELHYIYDPICE